MPWVPHCSCVHHSHAASNVRGYLRPIPHGSNRVPLELHVSPHLSQATATAGRFLELLGPHWPDFRHHLLCNLRRECEGGEDEVPCPYYTERCGAGYVTSGQACLFSAWKLGQRTSWFDAWGMCEERGGRLATLKTDLDMTRARSKLRLSYFKHVPFYVGVFRVRTTVQTWYRPAFQWTDDTIMHNMALIGKNIVLLGSAYEATTRKEPDYCGQSLRSATVLSSCDSQAAAAALCEKVMPDSLTDEDADTLTWPPLENHTFPVSVVTCPSGHVTHEFLACDVKSACWSRDDAAPCAAPLTPLPPAFTCGNGIGHVPYSLVCDHRADCADSSDEDFCDFPTCPPTFFSCGDTQCIQREEACDGWADCFSPARRDEQGCEYTLDAEEELQRWVYTPEPPFTIVIVNGQMFNQPLAKRHGGELYCPPIHFRCRDEGNCLPLFLRCNGVFDCLYHEDEAACDSFTCPGLYSCRDSAVCLHPVYLCDGNPHCPQHDDELLCDLSCPPQCVCRGLAFFCRHRFAVEQSPGLRYLDAAGSDFTPADTRGSRFLVFLRLARCGLTSLDGLALPNLLYLDVSDNNLRSLDASLFEGVPKMRTCTLSGNAFLRLLESGEARHSGLVELDLSRVQVPELNATVLTAFTALQILNLSDSGIQRVVENGFQPLTALRVVDLRGSPVTHVPPVMFQGLRSLQAVYADSFRLCCPALLPADFNLHNCEAPFDEVSSCDDLLGSELYSALTFSIALVAVMGNCCSFVYRVFVSKTKSKLGFAVFVTHLSLSDFLMGVYLVVLGTADRVYKGRYLWNDLLWRDSPACKAAGFLSLLSSEVSALIMCLITLDRFLVLRFPFSTLHFGFRSAHLASCLAWLAGVVMATVPLLPVTSHWRFYGHSSICLPLPVTGKDFAGRGYSFGIVIVLNFVLLLFVCCGQLVIYWSVQANAMTLAATSSGSTRKAKDLTIARRLVAVAMSDFLAWFPIGLLGLLASGGVPIPGEVNVAMAVLVLPLNSALNPFLYTVNVLLERRRLAHEERLRKFIVAQLSAKS